MFLEKSLEISGDYKRGKFINDWIHIFQKEGINNKPLREKYSSPEEMMCLFPCEMFYFLYLTLGNFTAAKLL